MPAQRSPLELAGIGDGVETHELQRLVERQVPRFARGRLGRDEVASLDSPLEDRPRMPLRGHAPPLGPDGDAQTTGWVARN